MYLRALALFAVLGCLASATAAAAAAAAATDSVGELRTLLRGDVSRGFAGAVLIARDGRVLLDEGFGVEQGVRINPTSRFWIASSGKQFVSAAILKCEERGWLKLDDPIGQFLPHSPADKRDITIRQLLAHLSGLDQTYASEGASNRDTAVARMLAQPLIDRPGNRFHYSNDNYQLAAAIVEITSGTSYREFVAQQFWGPLGMHDTGFNLTEGARAVVPAAKPTPERLQQDAWGEAGVYSTTRDLRRWYQALSGGRVLSPQSVTVLFAPETPIKEGESALGWFRGKTGRGTATIFTRGNEDFGPNSVIYSYPERQTLIVVLTHSGDAGDGRSWSRTVLTQLEDALDL